MTAIEVKDLFKIYGNGVPVTAVGGVSFNVEKGEFVAIMGPSGSGKSTLLHILGLLDRPTSGSYIFNGRDVRHYSDNDLAKLRNSSIGFIFQSFNLLPRTSVLDNVLLPLLYSDISNKVHKEMAREAIDKVGLSHRLYHDPSQLSGGEKQRVAIARALVTNPDIIFADEPTGNLDSNSGGQVMAYIDKLHSEGKTVLLITHETYTAQYAQRIISLKDGLIERDDRIEKQHDHQQQFLK